MGRAGGIVGVVAALLLIAAPGRAEVRGTKHDFWIPGGGPPGSGGEGETCVFCHAPHTTAPSRPLWNHDLPTLVYTPYSSSSMQANPGQPTGASKLCLSCHDGTIALGALANRPFPTGPIGTVTGRARLGTDLSDDHPISFVFDSALAAEDGELVPPQVLTDVVRLDANGEMQCTSCHDAHLDRYGDFLLMDGKFSALCITCHDQRNWIGSSHDTSPVPRFEGSSDPWPESEWNTVAANGCRNCHVSHAAGHPETLLRFPLEEDNCLGCHDGTLATKDIAAELRKVYRHPVDSFFGLHDPEEEPLGMPRHVECHDCHDPHGTAGWSASAPDAGGALMGAKGVSLTGGEVASVQYQYEVCLRCHGDSPSQPTPSIERQSTERNLRIKFDLQNPSFHPVAAPGRSSDVPSLLDRWTPSSVIYCTDCHAGDDGPGAGGPGPSGPHGSRWPFLLEREYRTEDGTQESDDAYALCYKCHDRNSILADRSFPTHRKHIVESNTPCSACHDPHGVPADAGMSNSGTHLVNFDLSLVVPDPASGLLTFEDLGSNRGRCYLMCHGEAHGPEEY